VTFKSGQHTEETGFKQLVSCSLELELRQTSALVLDIGKKMAKCDK
jgi:hypothetical protein